jgi:hypothetical protein
MRTAVYCIAVAAALSIGAPAAVAVAQQSRSDTKEDAMAMPKPGPETAALLKLFGHGATWEGQVAAGALGPDAPATTSPGKAACRPIAGGFWCMCDIQDTMGSGKQAMTWRGHMIVGYDLGTKSYRAATVDNTGVMSIYTGRMEGGTLALETPEAIPFMGMMLKDRLTFVGGADGAMTSFKDEHQVGDGGWSAFETVDHLELVGARP